MHPSDEKLNDRRFVPLLSEPGSLEVVPSPGQKAESVLRDELVGAGCFDDGVYLRYLDAALDGAEQAAVELHLNECENCRAKIELLAGDAEFWNSAMRALIDMYGESQPQRPLEELSLSALNRFGEAASSLPCSSTAKQETIRSGLHGEDTSKVTSLSQSQLLSRWLDPSDQEGSVGRIGKYEVQGVVGQGGMGLVLRAIDTELNRPVAIKTMAHHVSARDVVGQGDARLRLAREARTAAALRHANVVPIYAFETWRDVPLIVMPLVEGGTLQQHVSRHRLSTREILSTALQIASALSALHAAGIVHRDLKPSNILLQNNLDHVLLSDFGLARVDGDIAITHSDALAGTPYFMSPEQALGKAIDARSDLFSFGSVLFWLCTGRFPFRGESNYATLSRLVHSEPELSLLTQHQVPVYLQRLIAKLLAKSPEERWASASQVESLLTECVAHVTSPEHPLPDELTAPKKPWMERLGGSRLLVTLSAITLLVTTGGLLVTRGYLRSESDLALGDTQVPTAHDSTLDTRDASAVENEPMQGVNRRSGSLDALDRQVLLSDFREGVNVVYWLRRLAYLPVDEVPAEALPFVQKLATSPDATTRELSQVILNMNPFQEVTVIIDGPKSRDGAAANPTPSSSLDNPFQEVSPE